jgi:murein DD-endopeptidase MepM/ murein hydrolase activator NlpD
MKPLDKLPTRYRRHLIRSAQLGCCALVAWAGIHTTARMTPDRGDVARLAVSAVDTMDANAFAPIDAALEVAQDIAQTGLSHVEVVVQRNDTLDQIFRRLKLSLTDLANLRAVEGVRSALDRLRPGDQLKLVHRDGELVGLERSLSLSQTLKVQRDEQGFVANIEEIPLERVPVTASGRIESSLFMAGMAAGLKDATTMQLAEIFRWDVDFMLDLRTGDSFRVIYEELRHEGQVVGVGEVLAAEFINDGRVHRAVRYQHADGKADFYTPDGKSLRKSFLKTPVKFSRISSVFNPRRKHPVLNTIRAHRGVDYAAPTGTPVYAAGNGKVKFRGVKGGYGNVVEIEHTGSVVTRYGHLSRFASSLKSGQRVSQGDVIGYVGMTGMATGPHLHFEYMQRGVHLDPQVAMRRAEPGPPIAPAIRDHFLTQTAPLLARLDGPAVIPAGALAAR